MGQRPDVNTKHIDAMRAKQSGNWATAEGHDGMMACLPTCLPLESLPDGPWTVPLEVCTPGHWALVGGLLESNPPVSHKGACLMGHPPTEAHDMTLARFATQSCRVRVQCRRCVNVPWPSGALHCLTSVQQPKARLLPSKHCSDRA